MAETASPTAGVICVASLQGRSEVSPGVFVLEFRMGSGRLPDAQPAPGQFYLFDCGGGREHMLPRPLSVHRVCRWDGESAVLEFLVEVVGWGSGRLCALPDGGEVTVLGPLGNGFEPIQGGTALLVAGGVGIAPIAFLAREMDRGGSRYEFLAGFRTEGRSYQPAENVVVYTEDGSLGNKGLVSDGAARRLAVNDYSGVYACGPQAMMAVVAGISEEAGVPCQVSLESRMGCGIGSCRGCVKEGRTGGNLCVCTEGPVFDSREVAWTESPPV